MSVKPWLFSILFLSLLIAVTGTVSAANFSHDIKEHQLDNGLKVLLLENHDALAGVYSEVWFYNLDNSRFEDYQENIRKVTQEKVADASRRYFPNSDYAIILVGKADAIKEQVANSARLQLNR